MENASAIFTKSRFGLDRSVWLTMLLLLIFSLLVLSFKLITTTNCTEFEITATSMQPNNDAFYMGDSIAFSIPEQKANLIEWDFGDGTSIIKGTKSIQHSFLKAGNFTVRCIINKQCVQYLTIDINSISSKIIVDTTSFVNRGPAILGRDTVYAGENTHFLTTLKAKYSYQWTVLTSSGTPVQTAMDAAFTFNNGGKQTIQLKVDDDKTYTKTIIVLPKKTTSLVTGGTGQIPPAFKIPPAIQYITPVSGGPGTTVTITGSFLGNTKSVSFGGIEAKFVIVSNTEITAIVGEGSQTGPVGVVTDNGSTTFANPPFTYIAPKVVIPAVTSTGNNSNTTSTGNANSGNNIVLITNKTLMKMLDRVKLNQMHVDEFNQFFYQGGKTLVYVNNDPATITFSDLCQRLTAGGSKITIDTAIINHDPDNVKRVSSINVVFKEGKDGFFKKIFKGKN